MDDDHVTKITVNKSSQFPTAAIVVIAVGGYILVFALIMMIRKMCLSKGKDFCPSWCAEVCLCTSCCDVSLPCTTCFQETCNCTYPNKRCCMDAVCPTKAWCDEVLCCCLSQEPEGRCLCCDIEDGCCDLGETCGCTSCKEYYENCKCQCCEQPETCDCCCIEIKLSGSTQRARGPSMMNTAYNNDGYMMNQQMVMQQPPYNNQPGFPQQSGYTQQPGFHQQSNNQQQQMSSGQYNRQGSLQQGAGISQQQQNMFSSQSGPSVLHPLEQVTSQWTRPGTSSNAGT